MKIKLKKSARIVEHVLDFLVRRNSKKFVGNTPPLVSFSFDAVGIAINNFGSHERDEIEAMCYLIDKLCRHDKHLALDIGANIGNHSVHLMQKKFNRVLSFEPNPLLNQLLEINVQSFNNIEVLKFGLSDKASTEHLTLHMSNWGGGMLGNEGAFVDDGNWQLLPIELKRLDDVVGSDQKVSFIKLDVEGHELNVLKGGLEILIRDQPVIAFEEHGINSHGNSAVINLLRDYNYEIYEIEENFFLGESKAARVITLLLQDIFGKKMTMKRRLTFKQKSYPLLVAVSMS